MHRDNDDRFVRIAKNRILDRADLTGDLRQSVEQAQRRLEQSRHVLGTYPRVASFADLFVPSGRQRHDKDPL